MAEHSWRDLLCPKCYQLKSICTCQSEPLAPGKSTVVRVDRETKGRRGKGVTVISDVPMDEAGPNELASKLNTRLGTGGTVKDGRIEIQRDHRDRMLLNLRDGYGVKRAEADRRGAQSNRTGATVGDLSFGGFFQRLSKATGTSE